MKRLSNSQWMFIILAAVIVTAGITYWIMTNTAPPSPTSVSLEQVASSSSADQPAPTPVPTPEPTQVPTPEPTPAAKPLFPQLDSSTARKDMVAALYSDFVTNGDMTGPAPLCSKTHQAICNLIDGTVDIVFALYPSQEEQDYMAEKNVDLRARCYAYDALLILGNAQNPVSGLSEEQLKDIYRGRITNWSEVGGPDASISVYVRDSQSGSQRMFESLVWANEKELPDFRIYPSMEQFDDMGEITDAIEDNIYAIGFNFMTYIDGEYGTSESLKSFAINGVTASYQTVADGRYPYITTAWVLMRADAPDASPAQWLFDWFVGKNSSKYITGYTSSIPADNSVIIKAKE